MFQSLGRDSVGWDFSQCSWVEPPRTVSIPRSGFCGVGPLAPHPAFQTRARFNPSVGILWGGTSSLAHSRLCLLLFQSLGRDSVGWDLHSLHLLEDGIMWVSIPRSGFCGVGLSVDARAVGRMIRFQSLGRDSVGWDANHQAVLQAPCGVSIPRSGFCGVGPPCSAPGRGSRPFQSLGRDSVGWDPAGEKMRERVHLFQSLGRDSVGWDAPKRSETKWYEEFQSLGRDSVGWDPTRRMASGTNLPVSIPRSGFCGVGLLADDEDTARRIGFNPSVGILWGGTTISPGRQFPRSGCFNPSVGILWGGTWRTQGTYGMHVVFQSLV